MLVEPETVLQRLLRQYAQHHQHPHNQLLHMICVPATLFATVGLLFGLNFGVALIALALAILYYARFGTKPALQMAVILLAMLAIWMLLIPGRHDLMLAIGIFILGLAGQFYGHFHFEQKPPAIADNKQHVLIGPLHVLATVKATLVKPAGSGSE